MSSRNDQFNEKMLSLDEFLSGFEDASKIAALSDNGIGAKTMYKTLDESDENMNFVNNDPLSLENQDSVKLLIFEGMLILSKQEKLIPILEQIVKNGKNRQKSIIALATKWRIPRESARRKYYRGVSDLLTLVSPNKNRGETHI